MSRCYSKKTLRSFLDALLPEAQQEEVGAHLDRCPACQARVERLLSAAGGLPKSSAHLQPAAPSSEQELSFLQELKIQSPGDAEVPPLSFSSAATVERAGLAPSKAPSDSCIPFPAIPGYEILEELGRGGMGVVYKARQTNLNRLVALKMVLAGDQTRAGELARFRAEAESLADLNHPNIVQVHEVGEHQGRPYLTLEYVDGGTLTQLLAGRPLAPRPAAELVRTLALAVQSAHEHGIIHRDLKPSNILVSAGVVHGEESGPDSPPITQHSPLTTHQFKIADFGLARRLDRPGGQTQTGFIVGTPSYMPPELASGQHRQVGTFSDVYGLGAILYECLTGRPPFRGETPTDTLLQVLHDEPAPLRRLRPEVPVDLETVCLKCLEKEPRERYTSAQALASDLRRFLDGEPVEARPLNTLERLWKWARKRPAWAALVTFVVAVLTAGVPAMTFLWLRADQARLQADQARAQAQATADRLEHRVYAHSILLANHAYQANDMATTTALLARCQPGPDQPDLRGWEWFYQDRLIHADLFPDVHLQAGYWSPVHAIDIHPDSRRFLTAGGLPFGASSEYPPGTNAKVPGELLIWDLTTGRRRARIDGHAGAIWTAAFSPDGRYLASGSADGAIRIRDADTFADLPAPPNEREWVHGLVFSPDSGQLAIASQPNIRLWDVRQGQLLLRLPVAKLFRPHVLFSPDGRRLLASPELKLRGTEVVEIKLMVVEVPSGKPVTNLTSSRPVTAMAFSRDGHFLALAHSGDSRVEILDGQQLALIRRLSGHTGQVDCLAFLPDGRLASGGQDRTVRIWDVAAEKEVLTLPGHAMGVISLAASPDGRRLVSGDADRGVKVWDLTADPHGRKLEVIPNGQWGGGERLGNLTFSADSRRLLAAHPVFTKGVYVISAWDAETGKLQAQAELGMQYHESQVNDVFAFSADGRRLAGVKDRFAARAVTAWDTGTGAVVASLPTREAFARAVALSRDGGLVAYSAFSPAKGPGSSAALSELALGDTATGRVLWRIDPAPAAAYRLAVSPDGRWLACAETTVTRKDNDLALAGPTDLVVRDLSDGRESRRLRGVSAVSVRGPTFSPNGGLLALTADQGKVRVWDTASWQELYAPLETPAFLTALAFSPDGRRLAGSGMDNLVRLWDSGTGDELLTLPSLGYPGSGHYGFTSRVAFSPNGRRLAANNWEGIVSIWHAGPR